MQTTYDQLQADAHRISLQFAKKGEMLEAAIMKEAASVLAHSEEFGKGDIGIVKAAFEWRRAITQALDSLTVEIEDTNPEDLAERTFDIPKI